jgi:hypothetical protein
MAIAYSGRAGTPTKSSLSITVGSVAVGSLLVAVVHAFRYGSGTSDIVTSVSSGGGSLAWTLAKRQGHSRNHRHETTVWFRENAPAGTTTATVVAPTVDSYYWNWAEYTGAATSGALDTGKDASASADGGTSIATGSTGALTIADSLAIGGIGSAYENTFGGPSGVTDIGTADGSFDTPNPPGPMGGRIVHLVLTATTAINWTFTANGAGDQGKTAAVVIFKGGTTLKRLKINNLQSGVNGTTDWTIRYWAADGATFTGTRVTGINAESSGGTIYVTQAQSALIASLAPGATVNVVALRPNGVPIRGLVGVVQGTVETYT